MGKSSCPLTSAVSRPPTALPRYGEHVLSSPWDAPISRTTVYAAFNRACAAAGISDFHWHDLRHTFASHLVMAGVDIRTVQELLGHKTLEMTMRYSHLAPAHKAAAVEKLAAALERVENVAMSSRTTAVGGSEAGPRSSLPAADLERSWNVPGTF